MGDRTGIEWTDASWNPATGCDVVSAGCEHCYAETLAHRFAGTTAFPEGFKVTLRPERLTQPLRWRRPRRVFVNSMSDLFHAEVPDEYIAEVFGVMATCPSHTFQILTKRHGRMRSLLNSEAFHTAVLDHWTDWCGRGPSRMNRWPDPDLWPLPNVWLGVSVENQQWANIRIPALLGTPAAVRFISAEPLLGPVDLSALTQGHAGQLQWVIVGGESGRDARPMHPDWARALRDHCEQSGTAFFFKQWGEWSPAHRNVKVTRNRWRYESTRFAPDGTRYQQTQPELYHYPGMVSMTRVGKRTAGRNLDGQHWDQYPPPAADSTTAGRCSG